MDKTELSKQHNNVSSHAKQIWRKHGSTLTIRSTSELAANVRKFTVSLKSKLNQNKERKTSKKNLSGVHNI